MNNKNNSKDKNIYGEEIERVLRAGKAKALKNKEIIKVLLKAIYSDDQAQAIAEKLTDTYKGMARILGREMYELQLVEGVTKPAAVVIECVKEVYRRSLSEDLEKGPIMNNHGKIIEYIRVKIGLSAKEAAMIIYLDKQYRFIESEVHMGTIDKVYIYEREVIKKALTLEAKSIILSHNHPGGSLEPSKADKAVTEILAAACQNARMELFDHILVSRTKHFSFKKSDLLF